MTECRLRCDVCGADLSFRVRGGDPLNEAAERLRAHAEVRHGLAVVWPHRDEAKGGATA